MSKEQAYQKLKIVRGQLDGVMKMIEDDRYCIDISTQLLSLVAQIKKANADILSGHMKHCVREAYLISDEDGDNKVDEMMAVLDKYLK